MNKKDLELLKNCREVITEEFLSSEATCAIASTLIIHNLPKAKLCVGIFMPHSNFDENHAWVEYKGKYIDITADQFGHFPKIFISSTKSRYYKIIRKGGNFSTWPCQQRPYSFLLKRLQKRLDNL